MDFWDSKEAKVTELLELKFKVYKKIMEYRYNTGDHSHVPLYWKEKGMLGFDSLFDYLNSNSRINELSTTIF
ncbi:hypothetical protein BVF97_19630 [Bacillus thuringiensis]|uniref:Uncharacterized protein n=2 Tax=Bacillus thuringiensis TaxID=1428 RepID=A0ABD6R631_BACTU|nr:hypothetical protein BVF97_19630 [Bacillus thuringiensis]